MASNQFEEVLSTVRFIVRQPFLVNNEEQWNVWLGQSEEKTFSTSLTNYTQAFDYCLEQNFSKNISELFCLHLLSEKSGLVRNYPYKRCIASWRHIYPFLQYTVSSCLTKGGLLFLMQVQLKLHINIHRWPFGWAAALVLCVLTCPAWTKSNVLVDRWADPSRH